MGDPNFDGPAHLGSSDPSTSRSQPATADACAHPELAAILHDLVGRFDLTDGRLDSRLVELERKYSDGVYAELVHLISHLTLEPAEAKSHWRRILEHRAAMQRRLGTPVDVRVALANYFVQLDLLKNPKVIEMSLFERTCASAYVDELTGLRNYRFLSQFLPQEILRSDQYGAPVSLVMIDVDDFKGYNDRHGHAAGNRALASIAALLRTSLRKVDVPARYGGEEFALVLPSTPKTAAQRVAERARAAVESRTFETRDTSGEERLTVSLGIATYPADAGGAEELLEHADRAMYEAKTRGKNRVRLYGNSRRNYRRIAASFGGRFRAAGDPDVALTTRSVSEGGMLFRTAGRVSCGDAIEVVLFLPGPDREVGFTARVVNVAKLDDGHTEVAIRVIEIGATDRWRLVECTRDPATAA
jgi:diguanylate cyclase (GGDEF)-like protein